MKVFCTFPDRTKLIVNLTESNESHSSVEWISKEGMTLNVWIPTAWIEIPPYSLL